MGQRKPSRVTLDADLTARLDKLIGQVKKATGTKLPRSHVVAVLVEVLLESGVDADRIHSIDDLKAALSAGEGVLDDATLSALGDAIKLSRYLTWNT